jgi:hypothetical protein
MRHARYASGFAFLLLAAAGLASADPARMAVVGAPVLAPSRPALDDPFPIRRIPIAEAQLEAAVKKLNAGPMTRMSVKEFEARVRQASLAVLSKKEHPRLVEASWTGALDGGDLAGEASLTILNRQSAAAERPWDPPNFALSAATWEDNSPAAMSAGLLRVPPGRHVLKLKWSAAGAGTDAARRFDMRLPPCPASTLQLDLPPDRTPTVTDDSMLSGPQSSPRDPKWKRWHLRIGGSGRLDLTVRAPNEGGGSFVVSNAIARYDLADLQLAATFEFELRTARGTVSEWSFAVPPGLVVTDAVASDRSGWRFDPTSRVLKIQTHQASAGGKFVVTAVGPPPVSPVGLPVVRPLNAVGGKERFEIRIPQTVALLRLEAGDQRLLETNVAADGTRTFVLVGSLTKEPSRSPVVMQVAAALPEFTTDETLDWRIESGRVLLTARVEFAVKRGPLFRVEFRPPAGFTLDHITNETDGSATHVAGNEIEFLKPLTTGQRSAVLFEFRGPAVKGETQLPYPSFAPLGACQRDGRVRFTPGPGWTLQAAPSIEYRGVEPSGSVSIRPAAEAPPAPKTAVPPGAAGVPKHANTGWAFDHVRLATITTSGHQHASLSGTILGRGAASLPIELPPGAELIGASVGPNWLEPGLCRLDESHRFNLPLPAGSEPLPFQIEYRLAGSASPAPMLPGEPPIERWWAVPPGWSAVWPFNLRSESTGSLGLNGDFTTIRSDATSIVLVRTTWLDSAGFILTALIAIAAWFGTRRANRTVGVMLLGLAAAVGAAALLGSDSWRSALLPPLAGAILGAAAIVSVRGFKRLPIAAALLLVPVVPAAAQAPAESDVAFIVNSDVVVLPVALLERLEKLAKPAEPAPMISAAAYSGKLEDGLAWFTVKYTVHSFKDGESSLDLPLGDVRLERATVDNQPAQPLAAKGDGYSIPLPGKGVHEVELRFAASPTSNGPERELRFAIPPAPDSRVEFSAPLTARQLQAIGRTGAATSNREKDAVRLVASLGSISTLQLRWREGPAGTAAAASVREGCIWDVSDTGHRLTACYQIEVKSGSVPSFRFDLPAGLEPTRVAVRSLDSLLVPTVIRDWNIGKEANGWRPLTIDLLAPADGRLLVTLECEPKAAPGPTPILGFPRILNTTRESAVYGLRLSGVTAESTARTGVIDFAADTLFRDFGSVPDLRLNPMANITAFSPRAGEVPELRPVLRLSSVPPTLNTDTTWNLEPTRSVGRGTLAWSGGDAVPMIEFQLSAPIVEIRGPEVAAWSQADGRVQVWLRKPAKDGLFEWSALLNAAAAFNVPLPQASRIATQTLRLRPAAGFGAKVENDKGWKPSAGGREQVFHADGPAAPPRVTLEPPGAGSAVGFGLLEFNGTSATFRAAVEIPLTPGRSQHLVLQLAAVPAGSVPTLDAPPGTIVRERKEADGSLLWNLDVPAGPSGKFRATLNVPLGSKGRMPLPAIDLRHGNRPMSPSGVIRAFGLVHAPTSVRLDGAALANEAESAALKAAWPGEAERLRRAGGTFWVAKHGTVSLVIPSIASPAPPMPAVSTPTAAPAVPPPDPRPHWIAAGAWVCTVIVVLMLFVRAPRSTWPEQLGLLGALIGYGAAGQFAWGAAVYIVARNVWLFRALLNGKM